MYPKKTDAFKVQRKQGLRFLRQFKNNQGHWIQCLDAKGQVWTIPEASYKKFRLTGFPYLTTPVEKKLLSILKQYPLEELEDSDVDKVFQLILETIQDSPATVLFPSLQEEPNASS
jgi:hypothetical protein